MRLLPNRRRLIAVFLASAVTGSPLFAATLPSGFQETILASGLAKPTAIAVAADGRVFVCLKDGQLRVIKNGVLLATPFLSLTVDSSGERGLIGVTLDPNFATNQFVYLQYTVPATSLAAAHNRVSRFTANGDVAVGSETILFELSPQSAGLHNAGAIHFRPAPDGKLYIAAGDNGTSANAQTLSNLHGKILRINADGTIPADNPFFTTATGGNRAIWALGLRNPFTFAVQPMSGRLFINDVGQDTWEEIDEGPEGANYGWPTTEGPTTDPRFVSPLYAYQHTSGTPTGCAITGGTFYNPLTAQFPSDYIGDYFFADYCGNWIYRIDVSGPTPRLITPAFATGITAPIDLQVGEDGSLYYVAWGAFPGTSGTVGRIRFTGSLAPSISQQPASITVSAGQAASFKVTASGEAPLSYRWQRNNANISGATLSTYTLSNAQLSDSGSQFRCIVTNTYGTATSNSATLTVVNNVPPVPAINSPSQGALYSGGDSFAYSGAATDAEDGTLPASAFSWDIVFHHDTHTHPFAGPITGTTAGTFTIPTTGETSANVWYRIHLTVKDSAGQTSTTYRDLLPRKVQVTLATTPSGLSLTLDGQPVVAPFTFTGVVGIVRTLGATTPQILSSRIYDLLGWSDGKPATHTITTPPTNATFTATYRKRKGKG
jgi:glucose/arabinose dehydrogenase